jgi:hypothetical protein
LSGFSSSNPVLWQSTTLHLTPRNSIANLSFEQLQTDEATDVFHSLHTRSSAESQTLLLIGVNSLFGFAIGFNSPSVAPIIVALV